MTLENTLPSFCLSDKTQYQETVLTVVAVSATPLKLNPPFPASWFDRTLLNLA